jgi:hypothetical protein
MNPAKLTLGGVAGFLPHDPEKWEPVFGQDHAEEKKRK